MGTGTPERRREGHLSGKHREGRDLLLWVCFPCRRLRVRRLARERADRKEAEAGVAYWLLSRENPEEGELGGCPVPMGVATR